MLFTEEADGIRVVLKSVDSKAGYGFPMTKVRDADAFSSVLAISRAILLKVGQVDPRTLSFGTPDLAEIVNWPAVEAAQANWTNEPAIDKVNKIGYK